jgi:hypothetical protein
MALVGRHQCERTKNRHENSLGFSRKRRRAANMTIYVCPGQSGNGFEKAPMVPSQVSKKPEKISHAKSPMERFLSNTADEGGLEMVTYGIDRYPGILRPKKG